MKHIGWCLDRIQIEMGDIPKEVISEEGKDKAKNILEKVKEYADTLAQIIQNSNFRQDLNQLETSSIEGVRLQAHEIEKLFKDLMHLLYVLDLYIKELTELIHYRPQQFHIKAMDLVQMIDSEFGGEKGELRKEFKIAIYEEEELRRLVTSEEHLAELFK